MSKHRVKTHRWNRGILTTLEHWFDSLEEATAFSESVDAHQVKVYNPSGEVIDSRSMAVQVSQVPQVTASDNGYSYPSEGYSF